MTGLIARSLGLCVVVAAVSVTLTAGDASKAPRQSGTPLISDWSSRHVVFSHPRTPEQAARLQRDVRYLQQVQRAYARPMATLQVEDPNASAIPFWKRHWRHRRNTRLHRDWSWNLGSGATVGAGMFPAKYSFSSTVATCVGSGNPDFVVFGTSLAGSSTQATIAALTNLYSGCGGAVPASYWGYNTGGQVLTSPVLSLDGTQVAFTQTSAGTASLVLLRWTAGGTATTPVTPTSVANGSYLGCTAPCMTTLALGSDDTNSSVYYDYASDMAWVGDNSGKLHQFTGVFKGTPAEVTTGWPVAVSGNILTSAVHMDGGNTFVGDSGGFLHSVSSAGVVTTSGRLDYGTGFTEGPIIDGAAGMVYAFSSSDNTGSAGVFQLSTTFAGGSTGTEVKTGTATAGTTPQYNGAFDHNYIYSSNNTGNLYVCGNPGGKPTLYQIPIAASVMGTPLAGPVLSTTSSTTCSPATDIYNATVQGQGLPQEWVFVSVQAAGSPTACTGFSCVMNFKVTQWQPSFTYNLGQEVLDSNWNIEVAENSGNLSGSTPPSWNATLFGTTSDGGVHWRNQGPVLSAPPNGAWAANFGYTGATEIIDSQNNIEIVTTAGTSGATPPTWPSGPNPEGVTTTDGGVTWYNLGANPQASLGANGGTSGIIIDNTTNLPGGSQVYYTNLQPTTCTTSDGTGGCAVQASQQGLN